MGKQQPKGSIEADSKKNSTTGRRAQGLKEQSELEEKRGLEGDVEPLRGEEEKRREERREEGGKYEENGCGKDEDRRQKVFLSGNAE
ncbi:hypothetical protein BDV33DRAFT_35061 [Aspergillus novoparasiticus]|uniref:Uncharacterized protein n=1 Tax=Aspergillus novoparasiticus TaxID=986946 RepID=A0A5N6F2Y4_9EURO|nr:hypothetical protein BDV33DRAFT_35061 [Aspergillus novoparasiticus]